MSKEAASPLSHLDAEIPELSVVMACFNAAPFLEDAVASALGQTDIAIEVLIIDDHSSDGSLDLARRLAARDPRITVLQTPRNSGPGGARNIGIDAMRGEWYGMLDCDDRFDPRRSRTLIDAARALDADMIADDLVVFGDGMPEHRHLGTAPSSPPRAIGLDDYFQSTRLFGPSPNLGFLKPLVRGAILKQQGHRYREDLRIGEDDEFVIRLLLAGCRYFVTGEAMYHYRKHEASISHRLSVDHAERMLASEARVREAVLAAGRDSSAYRARYASILDAVAFTRAIGALKRRDGLAAIREVAARPRSAKLFSMPIASRLERLRARLGLA